jgi:hypothetical protein
MPSRQLKRRSRLNTLSPTSSNRSFVPSSLKPVAACSSRAMVSWSMTPSWVGKAQTPVESYMQDLFWLATVSSALPFVVKRSKVGSNSSASA